MTTVEQRVIARLNRKLGPTTDNLHTSKQLVIEYEGMFKGIASKVCACVSDYKTFHLRFTQYSSAIPEPTASGQRHR